MQHQPNSAPAPVDDLTKYDAEFARWRQKNPGGTFSQFSTANIWRSLEKGRPHHTLGTNLSTATDWRKSGIAPTELVLDKTGIDPAAKVCDYGCGTLRIGLHLIQRQDAGCYFGIDVSENLVLKGIEMIGDDIIESKRPLLGTIKDKLADVVAAGVDVVFSFNVASHIHPDEQETFNENLKAICHRSGSRLLLHTVNATTSARHQKSGWAHPVEQYVRWMEPLRPVEITLFGEPIVKGGKQMQAHLMLFARD